MKKFCQILLLSASLTLPLAACQTTGTMDPNHTQQIDAALAKAEESAQTQGNKTQSLALLEQMYKRDARNKDLAVKYAQALREAGRLNKAAIVLAPLIEGKDGAPQDPELLTAYASTQAALGSYSEAEQYARRAVLLDPQNAESYHVLGIALDAQGFHEPAEKALRKALDSWEGDPSPVLNNLGLNLAAQGFIDEAIDTLRKAAAIAPQRQEIERNIRIVSALQSHTYKASTEQAPVPERKPL